MADATAVTLESCYDAGDSVSVTESVSSVEHQRASADRSEEDDVPLCNTARNGHSEPIALLRTLNAEDRWKTVVERSKNGDTPLHDATKNGQPEIITAILELLTKEQRRKAAFEKIKSGNTPLHYAARHGHNAAIAALLESLSTEERFKATVERSGIDFTPLHYAAKYGHSIIINTLLGTLTGEERWKAVVDKSLNDDTPLHYAARNGHSATITALLKQLTKEKQQDAVTMKNRYDSTPLQYAAKYGHSTSITALLELLSAEDRWKAVIGGSKNTDTPLHNAASNGNPRIITALLELLSPKKRRQAVAEKNRDGSTPLDHAARNRHSSALIALLEPFSTRERLECFNKWNDTTLPLFQYIMLDRHITDVFPQFDSKLLSIRNNKGENLLHLAADCGNSFIINFLLESLQHQIRELHLTVQDNKNHWTPLHVACQLGKSSSIIIMAILNQLNPKGQEELLSIKDKQGKTSLHLAAQLAPLATVTVMIQMASREDQLSVMTSIDRIRNLDNSVKDQLCSVYGDRERGILRRALDETPSAAARNPDIKTLIEWSERQHGFYYLPVPPTILIFYNERDREELSVEEANSCQMAFTQLGFRVESVVKDFTTEDILGVGGFIRRAQTGNEPLSCLMVVIMAHGKRGLIYDRNNCPIDIDDVLKQMASRDLKGIPKLLVMQCCQDLFEGESGEGAASPRISPRTSRRSDTRASNPIDPRPIFTAVSNPRTTTTIPPAYDQQQQNSKPFELSQGDFTVLVSTVSGNTSQRHHFIPALAHQLKKSKEDDDIDMIFTRAHHQMQKWVPDQIPECRRTLTKSLALKHVFHRPAEQPCSIL